MAKQYAPHIERLLAVAASGKLLAVGGRRDAAGVTDSSVHLLQLPKLNARFSAPLDVTTSALAFCGDDLLLAGTANGDLAIWRTSGDGKTPDWQQAVHGGAVRALVASDSQVLSVGDDGVLALHAIETDGDRPRLREQVKRRLSEQALRAVALDPASGSVAATGADNTIHALPLANLKDAEPRVMPCGERGIFALAFTGDGRIVAGCGDGSIRVCFLEGAIDEEDRSGDAAHQGPVRGLLFSAALNDEQGRPLPRRLFSLGEDGELKVWTLDQRRKPRTVPIGRNASALALFAPLPQAKPEQRGGLLVAVTEQRQIWLSAVDQSGNPSGNPETWDSRLQRLLDEVKATRSSSATLDALAQLAEDEAREGLEWVLSQDSRPGQRLEAAQKLGASLRRRSRPALVKALNDDHVGVRKAALKALQQIDAETPLQALQPALSSRHPDIRLDAVQRLTRLRQASPLVPRLLNERLSDADEKVREAALDGLLALEPDAGVALRGAFERGSSDIRRAVLIRLGRRNLGATPEGRQLLGQAINDDAFAVRHAAFWIAVAVHPALVANLRASGADIAKILDEYATLGIEGAAATTGATPTEPDLEPLFTALVCRQPDMALQSALCLSWLGDDRASGALLQLSREPNADTRRLVTLFLANAIINLAGDRRLRLRLQWLLNDDDAQVRAAAFDGLLKLAEPEGPAGEIELAELALRTQAGEIRTRALQLLVKHGATAQGELATRIDGLLGHALDDEAEDARREAMRTLWAWHSKRPETTLRRAVTSVHPDIRRWAVDELARQARQSRAWARELLIERVGDAAAEVGLAAYEALTKEDADKKRSNYHLAAINSPAIEVRLAGLKGALEATDPAPLRNRLIELLQTEEAPQFLAAIEVLDKLLPNDAQAFALAFDSPFYLLRVRAGELCGKRRDKRAVGPMQALLSIPKTDRDRPSDALRQRAASALADVGDPTSIPFLTTLLRDEDALVREHGARGLAAACQSGNEQPLVAALAHADLAVRSWAADGLSKLGDTRALPVLAGTQRHEHLPIRRGALYSFVALGGVGVQGLLQGLEDRERDLQELTFAVIVARDIALARARLEPDLLLSALSAGQPEIRYAAARVLEARLGDEDLGQWGLELIGPRQPEKASDMRNWPEPAQRPRLLNAVVNALASDSPARRYAAAQVLGLRPQPETFWREAKRLAEVATDQAPPQTAPETEAPLERKTGWIRGLFQRKQQPSGSATQRLLTVLRFAGGGRRPPKDEEQAGAAELWRLAFGTYAGLIRQAPVAKGPDDYQRVRRDSIARLAALAPQPAIGREAVLPVLRQALGDPHHLVRQAALNALAELYPREPLEPLALALSVDSADLGRNAFDRLLALAATGDAKAAELARGAVDAANAETRRHALEQLPRLYPAGSLEPWLLALNSRHDDLRLTVVDRLLDANDPRIAAALSRALESEHDELRLRAAVGLAQRGEALALDVLAAALRAEPRIANRALEALVALAHSRPNEQVAARATEAVTGRLEDDPDLTADRPALLRALGRIGHVAAASLLGRWLLDKDKATYHGQVLDVLLQLLRDRVQPEQKRADGRHYPRYQEEAALQALPPLLDHDNAAICARIVEVLGNLEAKQAETLLIRLLDDRDEAIRALACAQLAQRIVAGMPGAGLEPLTRALVGGRRELLLTAAEGLAKQQRPEAFQPLLLAFSAGTETERKRAVAALGELGDRRALEYLEPLLDERADLPADDRALGPDAAEALGTLLPRLTDADERQRVRDNLERLAREGRGELRWRALRGLRRIGDERSRALLERLASDPYEDGVARQRAAVELGEMGAITAEPVLESLLHQRDAHLRKAGLEALRRIYPTDATQVNLIALNSEYAEISQPAARFLARQGDPATLTQRLGVVKDQQVRQRLRRGLIRRQSFSRDGLGELLRSEAATTRAEAAWIAGNSGDRDLAGAVQAALERAATGWRQADERHSWEQAGAEAYAWRAALWAARQLQLAVAPVARAALADPRHPVAVRREAIRCLAECGDAKDSNALLQALEDVDAGVRAAASAALARLGGDSALQHLERSRNVDGAALRLVLRAVLRGADGRLLASAEQRQTALPVYLEQREVAALVRRATAADGEAAARSSAIAALGRLGGEVAQTALQGILANKSEDGAIRAIAFKSLRRLERRAVSRATSGG
ncbi:MAG: HEAT repeat domain-containing protein [Candidatus Contendobacter sp.]|nr:HEAT repeat domain-containing protein [Candidatus Contendobacter sp.]MDG4556674.1 HEAT repeat domain-containing protein [Candidatus Contendobacter sp.]